MAKLINISIDVTKLDKTKFIAGQKGTYANITVEVKDEADQFGNNASAWQSQSKEEREAKQNRNYLGNGKIIWSNDSNTSAPMNTSNNNAVDDLPF